MGAERFGLLGIIWAGIGYFNLFDFGIGAALAKLTAEHLGKGQVEDLPSLLGTGLRLLGGLGVFAALVVSLSVQWLVADVLKVPPGLIDEAEGSFWVFAATLPFVTLMSGLTGILRAQQRFDQLNLIRIPLGIANFLFPVLALQVTPSLVVTTALLAISRIIACLACGQLCRPFLLISRSRNVFSRKDLRDLVGFGGWLTVSNVIGPIMVYFDRFVIGAMAGMAAVAYYTTPYEVVTRLWIIPDALFGVVFTALTMALAADTSRARSIFSAATRGLAVSVGIPVALVILFAREGLDYWLGPVFAEESAEALRWLGIGVFINCFARLPSAALQAAGRPDLTAKLHLMELPGYLILLWLLTNAYGVVGSAAAWTLRIVGDTLGMYALGRREIPTIKTEQTQALAVAVTGGLFIVGLGTLDSLSLKIAIAIAVILLGAGFMMREWRAMQTGRSSPSSQTDFQILGR
jgi:O-antigen/teichoic acid export membrane protein